MQNAGLDESQAGIKTARRHINSKLILNWHALSECGTVNVYACQEATVRTGHGTTNQFQIGKGVCQGCILSTYSFNLYAEYIMKCWAE